MRSLNSVDIPTSSFGNFLVPIVLNKLPQKLRLDIGRQFKSPSELWKLDELLKVFKEELTARETAKVEPESFNRVKREENPTEIKESPSRHKPCTLGNRQETKQDLQKTKVKQKPRPPALSVRNNIQALSVIL